MLVSDSQIVDTKHLTQKVSVVILNWNGLKHLQTYLPSVIQYSDKAEIVVADNGSTDDSIKWIKAQYPEVKILTFEQNLGFCKGYNRALASIDRPYSVLLNSDVAVSPDWLMSLVSTMENDLTCGACMPKLLDDKHKNHFEYAGAAGGLMDKYGFPFCRGRIFQSIEEDFGQYEQTEKVFWVSGAAMMLRTELFKNMGGLDERLFAHMEEIDLCWRMQHLGYHVLYIPTSVVYHLGGGTLHKSNPHKTFLNFRNSLYVLHKNTNASFFIWILLQRLCLDGFAGLYFLCVGNWKDTLAIVKAHFHYYAWIPAILAYRKKKKRKDVIGLFQGSIVWSYYFHNQKTYGDLIA